MSRHDARPVLRAALCRGRLRVLSLLLRQRRRFPLSSVELQGDLRATTWQPTTMVQCIILSPWLTYPGCEEPGGCHDLTLGRIYELLGVEADGAFYRINDDSGDDFLYPASHFRVI